MYDEHTNTTILDDYSSYSQNSIPILKQENFLKSNGLTEAQQFLVNNGFQVDKKQNTNRFKFRKTPAFVDSLATKSAYSL